MSTTAITCALCGDLVDGIPYGPPTAEVCLKCWHAAGSYKGVRLALESAVEETPWKGKTKVLMPGYEAAIEALIKSLEDKSCDLESEADDLEDQAKDLRDQAEEVDDLRAKVEDARDATDLEAILALMDDIQYAGGEIEEPLRDLWQDRVFQQRKAAEALAQAQAAAPVRKKTRRRKASSGAA